MLRIFFLLLLLSLALPAKTRTEALLQGARSRLGDAYSPAYFVGGHPPRGQSACVDVLVDACAALGLDLQKELHKDVASGGYPFVRDRDIDHRWAPNLRVWFLRHAHNRPLGKDFRAGDMVFWSLTGDGVADHCGVVSDRRGASGKLMVVHQFPPVCQEEDCLGRWAVVGHFRL